MEELDDAIVALGGGVLAAVTRSEAEHGGVLDRVVLVSAPAADLLFAEL